jgi:hypothetical protein
MTWELLVVETGEERRGGWYMAGPVFTLKIDTRISTHKSIYIM